MTDRNRELLSVTNLLTTSRPARADGSARAGPSCLASLYLHAAPLRCGGTGGGGRHPEADRPTGHGRAFLYVLSPGAPRRAMTIPAT
jgi:hypothetical protein